MEVLGDSLCFGWRATQRDNLQRLGAHEPPENLDEASLAVQRKCREIASRSLYLKLMMTVELHEVMQEGSTNASALPTWGDDERRDSDTCLASGLDAGRTYEFTANIGSEELLRARPHIFRRAGKRRKVGSADERGLLRVRS